ncbi:MAG: L-threonylcarbamoyladenylate synthase, partial [Alphaproteobacteria bacterium]|nr:L-threonylcarbamoyladenylate synthase [Alphaproteobacteria bacterium]
HPGELADLVSAGLSSIAVRMPSHPVAMKLLALADCPVAAPSANRSGHVSATTAAHVASDLADAEDLAIILDDGPCPLGLESTIVDVRGEAPVVLRPGAVTVEEIARVSRSPILDGRASEQRRNAPRSSPGQLESHYAPAKPLYLGVTEPAPDQALLAFGPMTTKHSGPVVNLSPAGDLVEAASQLFSALRQLDSSDARSIAAMPVPDEGLGRAINDRLRRAAAPRD